MTTNPVPAPEPRPLSGTEAEYNHLLSYFKYLVTLTLIALGVIGAAGGFVFFSKLNDAMEDAKSKATRVATEEAHKSVMKAFDEKNINAMILRAAEQKVGTVTDKIVEQQVASRLRPIEERIVLIGRISQAETRIRLGFRDGLEELIGILTSTHDTAVLNFAKSTLE